MVHYDGDVSSSSFTASNSVALKMFKVFSQLGEETCRDLAGIFGQHRTYQESPLIFSIGSGAEKLCGEGVLERGLGEQVIYLVFV